MYSVLKNNLTILKVKLYSTKYDDFYFNTIKGKGEVGGRDTLPQSFFRNYATGLTSSRSID